MRQTELFSKLSDLYGESEFNMAEAITRLGVQGNGPRANVYQTVTKLCKRKIIEKRRRGVYCLLGKETASNVVPIRADIINVPVDRVNKVDKINMALELIFQGHEDTLAMMRQAAKDEVRTDVEELVYLVKQGCMVRTINDDRKNNGEKHEKTYDHS